MEVVTLAMKYADRRSAIAMGSLHVRPQVLICALLTLSAPMHATAQVPSPPPLSIPSVTPPDPDAHGSGLPVTGQTATAAQPPPSRVGSITVENLGVFDPAIPQYRRFPYNLLNRLHIRTRRSTICQELLFREGDRFDPELLTESERNLRLPRDETFNQVWTNALPARSRETRPFA